LCGSRRTFDNTGHDGTAARRAGGVLQGGFDYRMQELVLQRRRQESLDQQRRPLEQRELRDLLDIDPWMLGVGVRCRF
jgi:outer membrane protein W